jgi:hypothetical protein
MTGGFSLRGEWPWMTGEAGADIKPPCTGMRHVYNGCCEPIGEPAQVKHAPAVSHDAGL